MVQSVTVTLLSLNTVPSSNAALLPWLEQQACAYALTYALVHADDGVIWGMHDSNGWRWSGDDAAFPSVSPTLRWDTIQQLRLFGESAEVLLWREGSMLQGRLITDVASQGDPNCFDEQHLLWGRPQGAIRHGFHLMREGAQGLLHAPPQAIAQTGAFIARNYIAYDDDGCAYVLTSRLVAS